MHTLNNIVAKFTKQKLLGERRLLNILTVEYYSSPSSETDLKRPAKRNLLCFFTMYLRKM